MLVERILIESFPFSAAQESRSMHVGDSNVKGMMGPGKWLFFIFSSINSTLFLLSPSLLLLSQSQTSQERTQVK